MRHINPYPVFPNGYRKKESASFGPFTWPLRENYDARYVIDPADLANDPEYGVPDFLWKRGDGNGCTVGPPGFTFTLTGSPTLDGVTPFQTPDGVPLVGEKHTATSHRSTNAYNIDPADLLTDDQIVAVSFIEPYLVDRPIPAADIVLFSTETAASTGGWSILYRRTGFHQWMMWGSHLALGRLSIINGLHNCALTLVVLIPGKNGAPSVTLDGFCGAQHNTTITTTAPSASGGVSLGSYVGGGNTIGAGGQIIWAATWSGLGIGATWKADSNKLLKRLAIESAGMRETAATPRKLWKYQTEVVGTASWGSYYDRDGNLWPVEYAVPAAGDSGGLRHCPNRTNYVYGNSFDPQDTTGWTATGGAVLTAVADVADLTAAKLWRTGTKAFSVVNATGVAQYVWPSLAGVGYDTPMVACCLSVYARYVAGAGARLGWWDRSALTFTDVGAVSDSYVRTILNNTTPPGADCRFCLMIPDGCTLYFTLAQAESGLVSSKPILLWGSGGSRRPASIPLTEYTPAATNVGIVLEAAPLGYSGVAMGADNVVLDTVGGAAIGVLHMEAAAPGWATTDGTTQISAGSPTDGVYTFLWTAWRTVGAILTQYIQAGATLVTGVFDGTKGVVGLLRSKAPVADAAIKYIQVRYP
jgi:hypothetical protein